MNRRLLLRLALDLTAACLLVASLAYWWLNNAAHEFIGTAVFLLILAHNCLNRRWYGRVRNVGRTPHGRTLIALNLGLAFAMAAILLSGIVLSRVVFGFLPLEAGMMSRDVHLLAAYWAMVMVGLHVGLNWQIVMNACRPWVHGLLLGRAGAVLAGIGVLGVVGLGLHSAVAMDLGAKLINRPTLDMWDFATQTRRFFLNWLSILGLCAVLGYQGGRVLRRASRDLTDMPAHRQKALASDPRALQPIAISGGPRADRTDKPT